ncbi:hypothetical protein JTB14_026428 [Gonioctena quinquepunctata]|nr:hypothetical protein JTB14_026428 [Gonioctena quinquepunctata]
MVAEEFNRIIDQCPDNQVIYTDGSKTLGSSGSAFRALGTSHLWTLAKEVIVYTSELYAIMQSLRYAEFVLLTILKNNRNLIEFIWILSHYGIEGNELADQAARTAAQADIVENIPVRPDDIKQHLKQEFSGVWQSEWDRTNAKLRTIKAKVTPRILMPYQCGRDQIVITRLRI